MTELGIIKSELKALPVGKLIWDIQDRSKAPPWGSNIADTTTDLSNYFVTSTGRDLIDTLQEVLEELRRSLIIEYRSEWHEIRNRALFDLGTMRKLL